MTVRITHIGGPTALIEGGRVAAADRPGDHPPDLGPVDAVLLSHDHYGDNLDTAGRALLPGAGVVFPTAAGAQPLGGNARGLQP